MKGEAPLFATFLVLITAMASNDGAVALLAFPLVIYWMVLNFPLDTTPGLCVSRTLSHVCIEEGSLFTVTLELANEGPRPVQILVEDVVPRGVEVASGRPWRYLRLAGGETARWSYEARGCRGSHRFHTLRVFPVFLGVRLRSTIQSPAPNRIWLSPKPLFNRSVLVRANTTLFQSGLNPSQRQGSGVDFFEVREFQFGDSPRHVNWRMSSRNDNTLFLNTHEAENQANALIVHDSRSETVTQPVLEHQLSAVTTLAQGLMALGNRVSLLGIGGGLDWIPFGRGRPHAARMARALAETQPLHNFALTGLESIPRSLLRKRCQLIFVGPLTARDLPILVSWKMQGHHLLVLSPDYISIESRELGVVSPIREKLSAKREELLQELRRQGIPAVDWRPHEMPFASVLHLLREYSRQRK